MHDPIHSTPNSPPQTTEAQSTAPPEAKDVEQAASEFASLMEGKPKKPAAKKDGARTGTKDGDAMNTVFRDQTSAFPAIGKRQQGQGQGGQQQSSEGPEFEFEAAISAPRDTRNKIEQAAEPAVPAGGDSILNAFGGAQTSQVKAESFAATGAEASRAIADMGDMIAERILVSDASQSGDPEVRIIMKDSVLPGTEVRITQQHGEIQVQLLTDSSASHDLLSRNQQVLLDRLNEKLPTKVTVNVELDSQGQSDQQGRSRQQRDIIEELREDSK